MNSKKRFEMISRYQKADRFPIDYLAHFHTDKKLKKHFGIESEVELLDILGTDFYYLPCRDISQNEGFMKYYKGPKLDVSDHERTCAFGIRWHRKVYDHKFSVDEVIAGPLENAETEKDILNYRWPKTSDFEFSDLNKECEQNLNRVIVGGLWTGIMGDSYRLHGFQNFLLNMAMNPELIKCLIDKVTDVYLELNDTVFSALKGKLDVWFFGNDFGSQNGLLFSRDMWNEFFYENIKKLTSLAHSYRVNVMMHSCGAISEIIPDLINAGVDILDPVQVTAKGMEPGSIADRFGGKIIFHGGIDTQQVLPTASPDQVFEHAKLVSETLGKGNGYIFAPSQSLGPDIPVENIIAMYKAGGAFNG